MSSYTHNLYGGQLHLKEVLTTGNLRAISGTLGTAAGGNKDIGTMRADQNGISFFDKTGSVVTQQVLADLATGADLATTVTKVNAIIKVLEDYGLTKQSA